METQREKMARLSQMQINGPKLGNTKKHTVRTGGEGQTAEKTLTPVKAIVHHCIECMGFQPSQVKNCTAKLCALHPYRTSAIRRKGEPTD